MLSYENYFNSAINAASKERNTNFLLEVFMGSCPEHPRFMLIGWRGLWRMESLNGIPFTWPRLEKNG